MISVFSLSEQPRQELIQSLKKDHEAEQEADVDLKAPAIKVHEHTRKKNSTLEELLKEFHLRDEIISLPRR